MGEGSGETAAGSRDAQKREYAEANHHTRCAQQRWRAKGTQQPLRANRASGAWPNVERHGSLGVREARQRRKARFALLHQAGALRAFHLWTTMSTREADSRAATITCCHDFAHPRGEITRALPSAQAVTTRLSRPAAACQYLPEQHDLAGMIRIVFDKTAQHMPIAASRA